MPDQQRNAFSCNKWDFQSIQDKKEAIYAGAPYFMPYLKSTWFAQQKKHEMQEEYACIEEFNTSNEEGCLKAIYIQYVNSNEWILTKLKTNEHVLLSYISYTWFEITARSEVVISKPVDSNTPNQFEWPDGMKIRGFTRSGNGIENNVEKMSILVQWCDKNPIFDPTPMRHSVRHAECVDFTRFNDTAKFDDENTKDKYVW